MAGRRGRRRRRREGSGRRRVSFSPLPPRGAPLARSRRVGAARSPSPQNPGRGRGRERSRSARRGPGRQADVVGHLKFTAGGGRVKVTAARARAVCECAFPLQTGSAIHLLPRGTPAAVPARGARVAPGHPDRGRSGEQGHWRAALSANMPLSSPLPGVPESAHRAWVVLFFPPSFKKKKKMPLCSPFFACPLEVPG